MKRLLSILMLFIASFSFAQTKGTLVNNMPSGGTLTLGNSDAFNIYQTTAGQTIAVPNPTGNIYKIEIRSVGSVPFTLNPGGVVDTGTFISLRWIGTDGVIKKKWVYAGSGSVSGGGGGPPLTQTITNDDQTHAASGGAVYDFVQTVAVTKVDVISGKGLSTEDFSTAEKNKLAGIAPAATANSTDAQLRDRSTHTGTQPYTTITGFGDVVTKNVGNSTGTVAAGDDSRFSSINGAVQAALDAKANSNVAITAGTKTKITFDTKGFVTVGADATTSDITESTNKRYVTDAQLNVLQNTSGSNTGDQLNITGNAGTATQLQSARNIDGISFNGSVDITVVAPATHAATNKTTPVDADEVPLVNSASSNTLARVTWANIKATLNTYFSTLFQPANSSAAISGTVIDWNVSFPYQTLTGNTTYTFSNAANGKIITVTITGASTYTVSWPGGINWGDAGPPTPLITNQDTFTFYQVNGVIQGAYRQ